MSEGALPGWVQWLFAGLPMIRANVPLFVVILILMTGAFWFMFNWGYGRIIANKDGQIEIQDRQIGDYKLKLDGASPDQAKAKIDALERAVKETIGAKWEPLTKAQISTLATMLGAIEKSRAQIVYENPLGKDLANSILEAFKQANWDGAWIYPNHGIGAGIVVGHSTRGLEVRKALQAVANLPVREKDTEKDLPNFIYVGVGINPY